MPQMVPAGVVVIIVVTVISVLMRMPVSHGFPPRLIVLLYVGLADLIRHAGSRNQALDSWPRYPPAHLDRRPANDKAAL